MNTGGMIFKHSQCIINIYTMNIKRIFGTLLLLMGIGGLIYAAVLFSHTGGGNHDMRSLVIFGVLGVLFFFGGLGLVRTTKDVAE